jgi:23S rRNA pseudouridine2605 synthase/16S rRNA pseudouridine516 synthase
MSRQRQPKWLQAARMRGASGGDWLGRILPRAGILPFHAAEEAIRAGRCHVDGQVVRDPLAPVEPTQVVTLDGTQVTLTAPTLVLMFHKPAGIVTATEDREGGGTVFDALQEVLPPELRRYGWHAVGRLDRATSGLLLFSNDERFVAHATRPETHLPKTYVASTDGGIDDAQVAGLVAGVVIDDGPARAVSARRRAPQEVEIVLDEGRHHQARRMLNAVRLGIRALHREAIGTLGLDVPIGAFRLLERAEIRDKLGYPAR